MGTDGGTGGGGTRGEHRTHTGEDERRGKEGGGGGGDTVVEQDIQGVESELIHVRIIVDYQKCQDEEETLDTKIPRRECRVWFGRSLLPQ